MPTSMGPSLVWRVTRPFLLLGSSEPGSNRRFGAEEEEEDAAVGLFPPRSTEVGCSSRTRHLGMGITRGPLAIGPLVVASPATLEGEAVVWDTVEDCTSSPGSLGPGLGLLASLPEA